MADKAWAPIRQINRGVQSHTTVVSREPYCPQCWSYNVTCLVRPGRQTAPLRCRDCGGNSAVTTAWTSDTLNGTDELVGYSLPPRPLSAA